MNSFTFNAPVDQQAATVYRLEKKLEKLDGELYYLQTTQDFLEYGVPIPLSEFQVVKDAVKNKMEEIEDTKRQLREAQRT